ncbi:MAG: DUF6272 family protein [Bacteroidota bacterium]
MKTLVENLYNNNVVFSYYGFIDESVLGQILQITKSKLESNHETALTIDRVSNAINECGENIIKHNFYPDDAKVKYKSLLVISNKERKYAVDTINVVNASQKAIIQEQIDFLNSRNPEQLHALKTNAFGTDTSTLVSTGLLDLVLKADEWAFTFKEDKNHFLFNINYGINCLA